MSQSGKCKDNLNFRAHFGAAEKNEVITNVSNFDEKKCSTAQSFILKEVTSYKICILMRMSAKCRNF